MAEKMKAILIKNGKGPVENLYIGETERPKPTLNGQVLVKVGKYDCEAYKVPFVKSGVECLARSICLA